MQDIRISCSEAVEPGFCQVVVTAPGGHPLEVAGLEVDPADAKVLVGRLIQPQQPGTYQVDWHATAVGTHKTGGTYRFTIIR